MSDNIGNRELQATLEAQVGENSVPRENTAESLRHAAAHLNTIRRRRAAAGSHFDTVDLTLPRNNAILIAGLRGEASPQTLNNAVGPQRQYQVLIGNLPWWITSQQILDELRNMGIYDVLEIHIFEHPYRNLSKGYCCVTLGSDQSRRRVLSEISSIDIDGHVPIPAIVNHISISYFEQRALENLNRCHQFYQPVHHLPPQHQYQAAGLSHSLPYGVYNPAYTPAYNPLFPAINASYYCPYTSPQYGAMHYSLLNAGMYPTDTPSTYAPSRIQTHVTERRQPLRNVHFDYQNNINNSLPAFDQLQAEFSRDALSVNTLPPESNNYCTVGHSFPAPYRQGYVTIRTAPPQAAARNAVAVAGRPDANQFKKETQPNAQSTNTARVNAAKANEHKEQIISNFRDSTSTLTARASPSPSQVPTYDQLSRSPELSRDTIFAIEESIVASDERCRIMLGELKTKLCEIEKSKLSSSRKRDRERELLSDDGSDLPEPRRQRPDEMVSENENESQNENSGENAINAENMENVENAEILEHAENVENAFNDYDSAIDVEDAVNPAVKNKIVVKIGPGFSVKRQTSRF